MKSKVPGGATKGLSCGRTSVECRSLVVTHEMGFARKVANRVVFIDVGGKVLESCSKEEFFGNPEGRQPRTKDFLSKILQH